MSAIDATGLKAIQELSDELRASGRTLLICGAPSQPSSLLRQAEFHLHLGDENILPSLTAALKRAEEPLAASRQRLRPSRRLASRSILPRGRHGPPCARASPIRPLSKNCSDARQKPVQ
jgi:hypothetical protein